MAAHKDLEMQVAVYVYDLNNTAREFGFKTDEGWELNVATREEMVFIEKKYHPTIAAKVMPEVLPEMFGMVKDRLIQGKSNISNHLQTDKAHAEQQYLIAFNPKRSRY